VRLHIAPTLDRVHRQVIAWEPSLATANPRLRLTGSGRNAVIEGGITLSDGSWMQFATREPVHELSFSFDRILLGLAPAIIIILIGGVLVRQTLLPMRQLAQAAERVGSNEAEELREAGPRELRRVIRAFNRMQARIHGLIEDRTQALAAVGHDMRTPLARLRLRADVVDDPEVHKAMEADISEMEAMISSLLAYLNGEDDTERPVPVDLAALCQTVADDARDRTAMCVTRGRIISSSPFAQARSSGRWSISSRTASITPSMCGSGSRGTTRGYRCASRMTVRAYRPKPWNRCCSPSSVSTRRGRAIRWGWGSALRSSRAPSRRREARSASATAVPAASAPRSACR
jgi:hypothetical protein